MRGSRPAALVLFLIAFAAVLSHVCVLPAHAHGDAPHDAAHDHGDREHPGDGVHAASCEVVRAAVPGLAPPALVAPLAAVVSVTVTSAGIVEAPTPPVASSPPLFLLHAALLI
jgi:hypothetical protein